MKNAKGHQAKDKPELCKRVCAPYPKIRIQVSMREFVTGVFGIDSLGEILMMCAILTTALAPSVQNPLANFISFPKYSLIASTVAI